MKLLLYSQISTVQQIKFGNGSEISFSLYWAHEYLLMLGFKIVYVIEKGLRMSKSLILLDMFTPTSNSPGFLRIYFRLRGYRRKMIE